MMEPGVVQATVDDGVVTLTGRTARKTTALAAARLTEAVASVTGVVDRLGFEIDDTLATAGTSDPADPDPLGDWWIGAPNPPGPSAAQRGLASPAIMTRTQADRWYRSDSRARGPATSPDDAAPEPRTAWLDR